jgi:hypothetical protein
LVVNEEFLSLLLRSTTVSLWLTVDIDTSTDAVRTVALQHIKSLKAGRDAPSKSIGIALQSTSLLQKRSSMEVGSMEHKSRQADIDLTGDIKQAEDCYILDEKGEEDQVDHFHLFYDEHGYAMEAEEKPPEFAGTKRVKEDGPSG